MNLSVPFVDKTYLREHAREILERGPLAPDVIDRFLETGALDDPDIVIQVSSGSTGNPLLIPRTKADVGDIARRVWTPVVEKHGAPPERIALIGGISHSQAAMKMDFGKIALRSFEADQVGQLREFDPVVLSCYPSVLRELLVALPERMPGLKAIKLGGERIFAADLRKIFQRFPDVTVIEQFGSTEVPAVALRVIEAGDVPPFEYRFQPARFEYNFPDGTRPAPSVAASSHGASCPDGWHPLLVKDNFPDLLFPLNAFYDTGDEMLWQDGKAIEVRRVGDDSADFYPAAEELLALPGCVNVQFYPERKTLLYSGSGAGMPGSVTVNGVEFAVEAGEPRRIVPSNKMPLKMSE